MPWIAPKEILYPDKIPIGKCDKCGGTVSKISTNKGGGVHLAVLLFPSCESCGWAPPQNSFYVEKE